MPSSRQLPLSESWWDGPIERYRHDVARWTVGKLRNALDGLPDDMVLRAEVAFGPSSGHPDPWGNDQFVVTGATVDDGDYLRSDELIIRVDYPADDYVRPANTAPEVDPNAKPTPTP
ncbi:hypothetical protein GCM10027280_34840 [Micromonospora polyrhachis]|uniref:Uncharacterized protein n=1 Tax=Micromonospora polyrhachis TaxID=1282883 RepID=A0A7W7SSC8_9ACTN|nr:DUF6225 family protein [Micromonospora polyrhachis]MBB4959442.1 hypothetical protein [Micromonospora polyrhachis]